MKEDHQFVDVNKLSIDELIDLEAVTASHKLLDHITLKGIVEQLPPASYEGPKLEIFHIITLYPTQSEIEKAKYDRLGRLYTWDLPSCRHIDKGQKINLADIPIVVLTSPFEIAHKKLILSGHARARYKLDQDPNASIMAITINCYDEDYIDHWSQNAENLKSLGIKSLKDLKFY